MKKTSQPALTVPVKHTFSSKSTVTPDGTDSLNQTPAVRPLLSQIPSLLIALLVLAGCSSSQSKNKYAEAFQRGDYNKAYEIGINATGKMPDKSELYWQLHTATAAHLSGKTSEAIKHFDYADHSARLLDTDSDAKTVAQYAASIFLNDNTLPYSGKVFERIMISTYKGLAFLELQDVEKARVEFNRTRDWQADAIERFSKEIAKEEEAVAKAKQENAVNTDAVLKDIRFKEEHVNVPNFIPYGDFINPFASYLAGLSALLENDFTKAADLLKETSGMVPENKQVARDYALAKAGVPVKNQVWIIIENGLCPKLEEVKIAYMFPVPGERGFLPVSVFLTFPKLVNRPTAQEQFHIGADGNNYLTETVCDFNRVSRTEFNKTIAAVTTREIIRASVKAVAQYAANRAAEKQPAWARLAVAATGTIVAYATAGADTRQWTTLPANIQILALPIPADRKIHIRANTGETTVDIPACRNAILYYRVPTTLKTAALPHVIPLK